MLLRDDKKRRQARKPARSRIAGMRRQLHSLLFRWSWHGALFASGLAMKAGSGHADPGSLARQGSFMGGHGRHSVAIPVSAMRMAQGDGFWVCRAAPFIHTSLDAAARLSERCVASASARCSQGDCCLESFLALASAEALFAGLEPVLMEWRREKAKTKNRRAEPCGCFALHDVLWCPESDSNRHALRRGILNPLRLPISPSGRHLRENGY